MSVLGVEIAWALPARLRLVGVIVQVVDVLAQDTTQTSPATKMVLQWLKNLHTQQSHGKIDAFGLLKELGRVMEDAETQRPEAAASAKTSTELSTDLEMQVIEAARIISVQLDSQVLEKALIATVVTKDFHAARELVDDHELMSKFAAVSLPSAPQASVTQPQRQQLSPPRVIEVPDAMSPVPTYAGGSDNSPMVGQEEAMGNSQLDVEDTLAAMMEMGSEAFPEEEPLAAATVPPVCSAVVKVAASQQLRASPEAPTPNATPMEALCTYKPWTGKRKHEDIEEIVEDGFTPSPPSTQPRPATQPDRGFAPLQERSALPSSGRSFFDVRMPTQGQASSSSSGQAAAQPGNALFDDSPIRSTPLSQGVTRLAAPGQFRPEVFQDQEVPAAGSAGRTKWTSEEEQRLISGHERYGGRWEHIRTTCGLKHKFGTQIRDKWVNLVKTGRAKD